MVEMAVSKHDELGFEFLTKDLFGNKITAVTGVDDGTVERLLIVEEITVGCQLADSDGD